MESLKQNLVQGWRLLRKQPGFSAMAILVLALGMGANSAMFSLVNAFLFKPLMIRDAGELVGLYSRSVRKPDDYRAFSYAEYARIREGNTVFTDLVAHNLSIVGVLEGDTTRRAFADSVSSNYFATFGVALARGREFSAEEERPGSGIPVAIVSHPFWKKRGSDPALVGRTISINGRPFTVVGVAPAGFTGTTALISPELYLPLGMYEAVMNDFDSARRALDDPSNRNLMLLGRLRRGTTLATADARLAATAAGIEELTVDGDRSTLVARPLSRVSVSTNPTSDAELRVPALLLLFLSGIVLLVASLNVANMMLARGAARRREIAIRLALGAGRRTLLAQLFAEGLLLALLGGAAGLVVAYVGTTLLVRSLAGLVPLDVVISAAPDARVLAATIGFCFLSTLLFSLVPGWNLSRPEVATDLKPGQSDPTSSGKPRRLLARRNLLVIGQLSLSLMLLSVAGLFIRSALAAAGVDPGFRTTDTLIAEVDPSLAGYDSAKSAALVRAGLERLRSIPGVESASVAATVPFGMISLGRSGQRATDPPGDARDPSKQAGVVDLRYNLVDGDYFRTMGIGVERGRTFSASESGGGPAPRVAILDRAAAERLWPGGDAVGQSIRLLGNDAGRAAVELEVVGVVGNIQEHMIGQAIKPHVYVPFGQETQADMNYHVRLATAGEAATSRLVADLHRELRAVDERLPILTVRTLRQHLDASFDVWLVRTGSRMFSIFGVVAVILAGVGLYGVRSFTVARRTREIGIRMALGSTAREALLLILREGLKITAIGAGFGLLLSLALGKVLSGMLYKVSGADPVVLFGAPLLLGAVSLLACYVPARRAAHVEPMVTLRAE
ncbi:MAG: ABC transporter permease [Thermoanaerobaculia bacterium]